MEAEVADACWQVPGVDVVDDLLAGKLHPERDDWLTLNVIDKGGRLITVDNRRLWYLQEFHRRKTCRTQGIFSST